MIIDFSVQNFGSIKDKQTLSFEADKSTQLEDYYVIKAGKYRLLKLALIYGANASGKTTVLNALNFLRMLVIFPREQKTFLLPFEPYLFDKATLNKNSILSINFIQNGVRYFYQVEFNKKYIVEEQLDFFNPNKANIFTRTTDAEKQLSKIIFGSKIKADKTFEKTLTANTLWNNTVLGGFLKTNIDLEEIREVTDWFSSYLQFLITPNVGLTGNLIHWLKNDVLNEKDIVKILKKADFNISGIKIDEKYPDGLKEYIENLEKNNAPVQQIELMKTQKKQDLSLLHTVGKQTYNLPLLHESQGTQRYLGLAGVLSLLIKESTLIPIDELESSLHPDLYIHFLLTFLANAKQSQLIATTHNREILADKDIFRNDAIWFTDKSATGATELYSLADFDTSVVRDTSNIYNAYKTGKLGGVPNLGDYYIDLAK